MKAAFVCPFNLERLTGTPIRAKTTISSVAQFSEVFVITPEGKLGGFISRGVKELRQLKPNVIHGFTTVSIIPMLLYKIFFDRKVKIIFEMHGWTWYETRGILAWPKRLFFLILDWLGFTFANAIIAMSYTEKKFLQKRLWNKNKVWVIWGPADFEIVFEAMMPRNYIKVGYIGNSSWWQGLDYLIGAAKLLLGSNLPIKLALAGFDYSETDKFSRLRNVIYVGKVERKDVPTFIKSCDLMVSPRVKSSVSDLQYPQKLSEYLACGRAIIASDTSDQRKIITEAECGSILGHLAPESLAAEIKRLATLSYSERNRLGHNAAKYAEQHVSGPMFRNKLLAVYRALA